MAEPTKKELKTEVARLHRELAEYKTSMKAAKSHKIRNSFKWFSFALACAILVVANLSFYSARTLVETDKFTQVASGLLAQPAVQTAIADKTTKAIFENVDTEQYFVDVLPERADIVAPVLAGQLEKFTLDKSKDVLANSTFQQKATTIISSSHEVFIEGVRNYQGDGTININDIYQSLSDELQNTKLAALADKQLPPRIGNIQVFETSWLPTLHNIVANLTLIRVITAMFFLGLMGVFIWLSNNRRRALMQIGITVALLGLITLMALNIAKGFAVDSAVYYPEAVEQIWTVLTGPLITQTVGAMALGLAVAVVAWLGSGSKGAKLLRIKIDSLLSGRLHQTIFSKENKLTLWVGKRRKMLQLTIGLGFIACIALASISWASIISIGFVFALLGLSVEALAAPKKSK